MNATMVYKNFSTKPLLLSQIDQNSVEGRYHLHGAWTKIQFFNQNLEKKISGVIAKSMRRRIGLTCICL